MTNPGAKLGRIINFLNASEIMEPSNDLPKVAGPEWSPGLLIPSLPSKYTALEAPAAHKKVFLASSTSTSICQLTY